MSIRRDGYLTPRIFWPGQSRDDWHVYCDWARERYGRRYPMYGKNHPDYVPDEENPTLGHWQESWNSFILSNDYPQVINLMNTRSGNPRPVVAELGMQAISATWNSEPLAKTQESDPDLWVTPTDYVAACAELQRMCIARDASAEPIVPKLKNVGEAWIGGKRAPEYESGAPDFAGVNNVMRWAERMAHYAIEKGVPWITVDANKKVWAVDPENEWAEPEWAH